MRKQNLHCSLPAHLSNNITGHRWEGITHCKFLCGYQHDNGCHPFAEHEMDEHFRRALNVVEEGEIFRTDIDGNYVFAQVQSPFPRRSRSSTERPRRQLN